jgi:hypothetical protein
MAEVVGERYRHQREVLGLLLAVAALVLPLSGAALSSGFAMPGVDWWTLGAVSQYDFLPVLLLVGAFGVLVVVGDGRSSAGSARSRGTAMVVVLAAAVLAVAYVGAAFQLRAGGPFDGDPSGDVVGWSASRVTAVGSLLVLGTLCATVLAMAVRWISERKPAP